MKVKRQFGSELKVQIKAIPRRGLGKNIDLYCAL